MTYYHVRITQKSGGPDPLKLDFSRQELELRVLEPYREGRPITISGQTTTIDDIERVKITTTDQNSVHHRSIAEQHRNSSDIFRITPIEWEIIDMGDDVTDEFITGPPGSEVEERPAEVEAKDLRPPADTREVFVVHGRNLAARDALFEFLRAVDLHPLEWSEAVRSTGKPTPYIGDILDAAFSRAHAVVVLFTPDDEARLRKPLWGANEPPHETQLTGQARANVLFEAGMAMARSQDRTVLIELGNLRPFSDIGGRHTVRLDNSSQQRQELAKRLEVAGCPVNREGKDWHTAGDFGAGLLTNSTTVEKQSAEGSKTEEEQFSDILRASREIRKSIPLFLSPGHGDMLRFDAENIGVGLLTLRGKMERLGMYELGDRMKNQKDVNEKLGGISNMLGRMESRIANGEFEIAKQECASYDPS